MFGPTGDSGDRFPDGAVEFGEEFDLGVWSEVEVGGPAEAVVCSDEEGHGTWERAVMPPVGPTAHGTDAPAEAVVGGRFGEWWRTGFDEADGFGFEQGWFASAIDGGGEANEVDG